MMSLNMRRFVHARPLHPGFCDWVYVKGTHDVCFVVEEVFQTLRNHRQNIGVRQLGIVKTRCIKKINVGVRDLVVLYDGGTYADT